ncbi:hypothetical protein LIER_41548 [Lithospermum erythrorhizon]|uniref:Uncharacterized protein n=1 Tax=Lithospermum erythrorhizon TaxID=34254 RepID=A0AAV3RB14_LITER
MAGQVRAKGSSFDDETFRIAYEDRKNCFSVRIHYGGKLVANPMSPVRLNYLIIVMSIPLRWVQLTSGHLCLTEKYKFIDVYFAKADNTDLLLDMEDENGNIKLSDWCIELLKDKADARAKLSIERASVGVVEFNLEEEDSDGSSVCDTGDVEETEAMDMPIEDNLKNK